MFPRAVTACNVAVYVVASLRSELSKSASQDPSVKTEMTIGSEHPGSKLFVSLIKQLPTVPLSFGANEI